MSSFYKEVVESFSSVDYNNLASQDCSNGQIQLILGPMFSGKTSELLRRIRRYTIAKYRCLVIKYAADTRYSQDCASTHDQLKLEAFPCSKLGEIKPELMEKYDVLGIDEGQFFSDIVEFSEKLANKNKVVIVAALDGTFQRKPFGRILELIPLAESICKLTAVCTQCCNEASFTLRLGNETQVEIIGGTDKYVAACRSCFLKMKSKREATPPMMKSKINSISESFRVPSPVMTIGYCSGRGL